MHHARILPLTAAAVAATVVAPVPAWADLIAAPVPAAPPDLRLLIVTVGVVSVLTGLSVWGLWRMSAARKQENRIHPFRCRRRRTGLWRMITWWKREKEPAKETDQAPAKDRASGGDGSDGQS